MPKKGAVYHCSGNKRNYGEGLLLIQRIISQPSLNPKDVPYQFDYYLRLVGEEDRFEKIATFSSQIAINYTVRDNLE